MMTGLTCSRWVVGQFSELVSVIIPTFNRSDKLLEALSSVVAQSHRPIEVLVVDDGSTDDTERAAKAFACEHKNENFRILYIRQRNAGAPAARNNGLRNAVGEFIQFLDSDDLLKPGAIAAKLAAIKESGAPYAYDSSEVRNDDGDLIGYCGGPWPEDGKSGTILNYLFDVAGPLLPTSVCVEIGPWDETLRGCQEIEYFLRLKTKVGKGKFALKGGHIQRVHSGPRISQRGSRPHALSAFEVLKGADRLLDAKNRWPVAEHVSVSRFACDVISRCAEAGLPSEARGALVVAHRHSFGRRRLSLSFLLLASKLVPSSVFLRAYSRLRRIYGSVRVVATPG
jgi:glycosyltransferase involved in cell wall biosynthesis